MEKITAHSSKDLFVSRRNRRRLFLSLRGVPQRAHVRLSFVTTDKIFVTQPFRRIETCFQIQNNRILLPVDIERGTQLVWVVIDGQLNVIASVHRTSYEPFKHVYKSQRGGEKVELTIENADINIPDLINVKKTVTPVIADEDEGEPRDKWVCDEIKGSNQIEGLFYVTGDHFDLVRDALRPPMTEAGDVFAAFVSTRPWLNHLQRILVNATCEAMQFETHHPTLCRAFPFESDIKISTTLMLTFLKSIARVVFEDMVEMKPPEMTSFTCDRDEAVTLLEVSMSGAVQKEDTVFSPYFNPVVRRRWDKVALMDAMDAKEPDIDTWKRYKIGEDNKLYEGPLYHAEFFSCMNLLTERYIDNVGWTHAAEKGIKETLGGLAIINMGKSGFVIQHPLLPGYAVANFPPNLVLSETLLLVGEVAACQKAWGYSVRSIKRGHDD